MDRDAYYKLSCTLQDVAKMPEISITVLVGTERYFSAGADVTSAASAYPAPLTKSNQDGNGDPEGNHDQGRRGILNGFVSLNLDITKAFYSHPKILVTALNGPAVGLSAALIAWSDFVYATPHAFLLTPFSSLGLVAEGGASIGFVQRMGITKAKEALIMSKRISCEELVQTGFVNKVFQGRNEDDHEGFLEQVLSEVEDRLGAHLNQDSLLEIKKLVQKPFEETIEAQGVREVTEGLSRWMSGAPQEEFRKLAAREKRHKL